MSLRKHGRLQPFIDIKFQDKFTNSSQKNREKYKKNNIFHIINLRTVQRHLNQ